MKRIQRKRTAGWKMPLDCIYVGRPTKWGNPYKVGSWHKWVYCESIEQSVSMYREYVAKEVQYGGLDLHELKGKNLACWCPLNKPCHADVLIEMCNKAFPQ